MKTVYISGQITGLPVEEYTYNFERAEFILALAWFKAVSPLKLWHPLKFYYGYLLIDLIALCFCDCVYFLDNWDGSRGATIERKVAEFLRKKIIQL